MQPFYLLEDGSRSNDGDEGGKYLEDDRLQVGQLWDDLLGDFEECGRYRTGMSIEPEAVHLGPAGQMYFPDTVERELSQEFFHGLSTIQCVRKDVVQIEQETAVRRLDNVRGKDPIGHLVRSWLQVIDAGFYCDG